MTEDPERRASIEFFTCSICYEIYRVPKCLPCLHTFCENCISEHIQASSIGNTSKGFKCPVCRRFVEVPRPEEPVAQWAKQLQDNFPYKYGIEAFGLRGESSKTLNHSLCTQHGHKLDLVCVSCNTPPVCCTCVAVSHRMCTQVYTVATAAQERRDCLGVLLRAIEERLQKVTCRKDELTKERNLVHAHKTEAIKTLTKEYDEAIRTIKENFDKLMTDIEKKCEKYGKVYDGEEEELATYEEQILTCQKNTEKIVGVADISLVNQYHEVKVQIDDIIAENKKALPDSVPAYTINFEASPHLTSKLEQLNLGHVTVAEQKRRISTLTPLRPPSPQTAESLPPSLPSPPLPVSPLAKSSTRIKFVKKVPAKLKGDKTTCDLRDVTIVNGNTIVVTDGYNTAVKSFFTECHRLQSSRYNTVKLPHGITTLSGSTVAVMVPKQKEMLLLDVTPNIILQKKVTTAKSYYAVTTVSPEYLAVSTCPGYGPPSIDIISTSGELHLVIRDHTNVGNLLSNPMSMSTTPQRDVVITDPTLPSVVCIRQNGYKVFEYEPTTDYKMKTPNGVAVDKHGAILVADRDSNCVVLLSPDGTPVRRILSKADGLPSRPKAVGIGDWGMLVTVHTEKIFVFQVQ